MDEMLVIQCISLNVRNMKLIGAEDFGQESDNINKTVEKVADHALVFMWSSLGDNFSQPIAVYAPKVPLKENV